MKYFLPGLREETLKYYDYHGMLGEMTFDKFIMEDFCPIKTFHTAYKGTNNFVIQIMIEFFQFLFS